MRCGMRLTAAGSRTCRGSSASSPPPAGAVAPQRRRILRGFWAPADPRSPRTRRRLRPILRFLALTGARKAEALGVRWADVDFANLQVTIGATGNSKGGKARAINFTPELAALLREITRPAAGLRLPVPGPAARRPRRARPRAGEPFRRRSARGRPAPRGVRPLPTLLCKPVRDGGD